MGRVGALAVALGIGAAIALPGVAYAETGNPDPGTNTANESPAGADTPNEAPSGTTSDNGGDESEDSDLSNTIDDDTFNEDTFGNGGGLDDQLDGNDDDLSELHPPSETDLEDDLAPPSTPDLLPPVETPVSELPVTPTAPAKEVDTTIAPVPTGGAPAGAGVQDGSTPQNLLQADASLNAGGDDLEGSAHERTAFRTFIAPDEDTLTASNLLQGNMITALEVTPPQPAQPQPSFFDSLLAIPGTLIGGVLDLVSGLLAPIIGPGGILNSPFLWGALLSVRRQFDQAFANSTPVLQPVTIGQDLDDGQVHGTFGGADPDGDTLTYTVPARGAVGGPAHGTVTINQAAGTWTYTPDNNGTPTNYADDYRGPDSFTVTASDAGNGFHIHGLSQTHAVSVAVTLNVESGNEAPTFSIAPGVLDRTDGSVAYTITVADDDTASGDLIVNVSSPINELGMASKATVSAPAYDIELKVWTFIYTPDPQQRVDAYGTSTITETDRFIVAVSDGVKQAAPQTVNVQVDSVGIAITGTVESPPVFGSGFPKQGNDGTIVFAQYSSDPAGHTTLIVIRPDGTVDSFSVAGSGTNNDVYVADEGSVVTTRKVGDGVAGNPRQTVISVFRPGGSAQESATVDGWIDGPNYIKVGTDGTVAVNIDSGDGSVARPYRGQVIILRSGKSPQSVTVNGRNTTATVGADGTVGIIATTGNGTLDNPYQGIVKILRASGTEINETVTGLPWLAVGDDGTVAVAALVGTGTNTNNYNTTTLMVIRPDGTRTAATIAGRADFSRTTIGADGTVAQTTRTGTNPFETTLTVIRADGKPNIAVAAPGQLWDVSIVGDDGTVVLTTFVSTNGTDPTGHELTITVVRPDGIEVSDATGYPVLTPVLSEDGTVVYATYTYTDPSNYETYATTVNVLRPNGIAETVTVPGRFVHSADIGDDGTVVVSVYRTDDQYDAGSGELETIFFRPNGGRDVVVSSGFGYRTTGTDGTVAIAGYAGNGSLVAPYETAITVLHPDGTTDHLSGIPGYPSANPIVLTDGTVYQTVFYYEGGRMTTTLFVVRSDGSRESVAVDGQLAGSMQLRPNGTGSLTTYTGNGDDESPYVLRTNTIAVAQLATFSV